MAVAKGPLFSAQVSGIFAGHLCFKDKITHAIVAVRPTISREPTADVLAHRAAVSTMSNSWNGLSAAQKDAFRAAKPIGSWTGYTWFFHQWFLQQIIPPNLPTP